MRIYNDLPIRITLSYNRNKQFKIKDNSTKFKYLWKCSLVF